MAAALAAATTLALAGCGEGGPADPDLLDPASGGEGTAYEATQNAFGLSARNLERDQRRLFEIGDSLFTLNWVTAPSSTTARDGLGPLHNAAACASCHVRDGKAPPPESADDPQRGLLLRLSVPGGGPDPRYGGQLQDRAINGVRPEGQIEIAYEERPGRYADGSPFSLRAPSYSIVYPAYGPLADGLETSPRIASQLVGMGLLEEIPEQDIRAAADPQDRDGDGISGRVNEVVDSAGRPALGRFGWKAGAASVADQTAFAFQGDIGITSPRAPEEPCTTVQAECLAAPTGGAPAVDDETLGRVAFYVQTLAVPARRGLDDPAVREGADVFADAGCTACHTVTHTTGAAAEPALADQTIHPYTDLLLHDMGPGLADGRGDGEADGREWRTPPLWGIGLVDEVNGHTNFLHDGRARDLSEAILWHGGEAQAAREEFRTASARQRAALLAFLESL